MQCSHNDLDTLYFVMNSARVDFLLPFLTQVSLAQFVSIATFLQTRICEFDPD